jgi:hypothetical protein
MGNANSGLVLAAWRFQTSRMGAISPRPQIGAAANLRRVGSVGSKTPGKVSGDDDHHKRTSDADEPPTINPPLRALTERLRAIAAAYKLFLFDDNSRS